MTGRSPLWLTSFADLALLLLAFFVMLQSTAGRDVANATRASLAGRAPERRAAAQLFEPGEARLLAIARAEFTALGREAAGDNARVRIESRGFDAAGRRFDGWELAAARTAAVARAVEAGGFPAARIEIVMAPDAEPGTGQRLTILRKP